MYVLRHLVIHPQNTVVTYPSHVSDMGLGELSQSPIKRRAATTVSYLRVVVLCGIRISFRYDNRVAKYRNNIISYCVGGVIAWADDIYKYASNTIYTPKLLHWTNKPGSQAFKAARLYSLINKV